MWERRGFPNNFDQSFLPFSLSLPHPLILSVKSNMAAMEALSYVGFFSLNYVGPPTRSFMFTRYVKTAHGD